MRDDANIERNTAGVTGMRLEGFGDVGGLSVAEDEDLVDIHGDT